MNIKKINYVKITSIIALLSFIVIFFSYFTRTVHNPEVDNYVQSLETVRLPIPEEITETNELYSSHQTQEEPQIVEHVDQHNDNKTIIEEPIVRLYQGDKVNIGQASCTAGYINMDTNQLYLAGHCTHTIGEKVYNSAWEEIGEVVRDDLPSHEGDFWLETQDFAVVQLYGGSNQETPNPFSGNVVLQHHEVQIGDPVCAYGATTQQIFCGTIEQSVNGFFMFSLDGDLQKGDSGGPLWIPERGLIGTVSGVEGEYYTSSAVII